MTDADGTVQLEGAVTEFERDRRLKLEFEERGYKEELALSAQDNGTKLSSHAGPVAAAEHKQHSEVWERGLQKIKELAEAQ